MGLSGRLPPSASRVGHAPRVGAVGSSIIAIVGLLYVGVIAGWAVVVGTPREPIGDPWLAWMEGLTMISAVGLLGVVAAVAAVARPERRVYGLLTLAAGTLASGLTLTVHAVQLTAVRQLWRSGATEEYRLIWPSPLFAVEYVAWDLFVGLTLVAASRTLVGYPEAVRARVALGVGGSLCLLGGLGPATGWMALQNVAVVGYAVVLPVAAALLVGFFGRLDERGRVPTRGRPRSPDSDAGSAGKCTRGGTPGRWGRR